MASVWISDKFRRVWIPQIFAGASGSLTIFALPLIAVVGLDATATQAGLLVVFQEVPVFLFSLIVGVWIDRLNLAKVLMLAMVAQFVGLALAVLLLSAIPAIAMLYSAALVLGVIRLVLDLGFTSAVPRLVEREQLVGANSRLNLTYATADVAAPAMGGLIARWIGEVMTLVPSAILTVFASVSLVRMPDLPPTHQRKAQPSFFAEAREGLAELFGNVVLRPIIVSSCAGAAAAGVLAALQVISLTRDVGLTAASLGLALGAGNIARLFVTTAVPAIADRIGHGPSMILGNGLSTIGFAMFAWATLQQSLVAAIGALLIMGVARPIYAVTQLSIRQAVTPASMMGRVNASRRFVVFSFVPIGAFVAGVLADATSTGEALHLAWALMAVATIVPLLSPLRRRDLSAYIPAN